MQKFERPINIRGREEQGEKEGERERDIQRDRKRKLRAVFEKLCRLSAWKLPDCT